MRLSLFTYNGTAINNGTDYSAYFPTGSVLLLAGANPVMVSRENAAPILVYKDRQPARWAIHMKLLGTIHSQRDTLATLFNPNDKTMKTLIAKDSADSDKQWYVKANCAGFPELNGQELVVLLDVPDPIWYTNTQTSDNWSITASAQTHGVTVAGNYPTAPVFRITPTAGKGSTGANPYRRFITIYNQANYNVSSVADIAEFKNYPIDITAGGTNTTGWVADTTVSNQINNVAGINASVTTIDIDTAVGGGLAASGMGYVDTEQISWTANSGTQLTGVTRGIGGTTAATHADNAVIARSKVLANGDDLKVWMDGVVVDRWFGTSTHAMNAAATQIWINLDLREMSQAANYRVATAIAGAGAVSTITLNTAEAFDGATNGARAWPLTGHVLIGSEFFTYTSMNPAAKQLTGVTRAAWGSSAAAHAINDNVRFVDHEIYMTYGEYGATTPTVDDTRKPIISLATSTNTSWVYGDFDNSGKSRTGRWSGALLITKAPAAAATSKPYTTSQDPATVTDPAAVMGCKLGAWLNGNTWTSENGKVQWALNHPAGATTVTVTGFKYRASSSWPNNAAGLWKGYPKILPTAVWTEATPGSAASWTALSSHSSVALGGTYTLLQWVFSGSISASNTNYAAMEATDMTFVWDSARTPNVTLGAEVTAASGNGYPLDMKITNTTSGEWLKVTAQCELNQTVEIDCENKWIKYLFDNSYLPAVLTFSTVRHDWLNLSVGTNTLQSDDTGETGVTFVTLTRDRNS